MSLARLTYLYELKAQRFRLFNRLKTIKPADQTTEQGFLPEPRLNFAPNGLRTDVTQLRKPRP